MQAYICFVTIAILSGYFRNYQIFAFLQYIQYAEIISGVVWYQKILNRKKNRLTQIKKKLHVFPIFANFVTREKPDIRYDILKHFSKRIRNHLLTLMGDINMVGHVIKSYKAKLFYLLEYGFKKQKIESASRI